MSREMKARIGRDDLEALTGVPQGRRSVYDMLTDEANQLGLNGDVRYRNGYRLCRGGSWLSLGPTEADARRQLRILAERGGCSPRVTKRMIWTAKDELLAGDFATEADRVRAEQIAACRPGDALPAHPMALTSQGKNGERR